MCIDRFHTLLPLAPDQVDYLELVARGVCGALNSSDYERIARNQPAVAFLADDLADLGCELDCDAARPLREWVEDGKRIVEFRSERPDLAFDTFLLTRDLATGEVCIAGESCQLGSLEQILSVVLARFDVDYTVVIPFASFGNDERGQETYGGGVMVASSSGASCVDGEVAGLLGSLLAHAPGEGSQARMAAQQLIGVLLGGADSERGESLLGALQSELLAVARRIHRVE